MKRLLAVLVGVLAAIGAAVLRLAEAGLVGPSGEFRQRHGHLVGEVRGRWGEPGRRQGRGHR